MLTWGGVGWWRGSETPRIGGVGDSRAHEKGIGGWEGRGEGGGGRGEGPRKKTLGGAPQNSTPISVTNLGNCT